MPARGVALGGAVEAAGQRARRRCSTAAARGGAEAERERGVPVAALPGQRQLRDLGDVALGRRAGVGPVHPEVVAQVGPAVALCPCSRSTPASGRARRPSAEASLLVAGDQRAPGGLADVVVAGVRQRGVEQRVELVGPPGERLEADVHQHRRAARVGHVGLGDPPAPGAGRVDLAVGEAARVGERGRVRRVLALALGERPAVRHDELEVADAGRAQVGRVDLGQLAVVERQPGLARRARRRAHAVLVALGPGRDRARRAGRVGGARGAGERRAARARQSARRRRTENPTATGSYPVCGARHVSRVSR